MTMTVLLSCIAVLLGLAPFAIVLNRSKHASRIIYGACFVVSLIALGGSLYGLVADAGKTPAAILPLGLPWLGAHFRLDALSAFFLVVVNLGTAVASLFAIGYGQHEDAPHRVLPFYPVFLAGMNLVVLADDAFTFSFLGNSCR
jgi:formate hydrogenlyase subunit 3/multisubunit Na+/H+ antiporter MnhD subunit